jgi:hypothetical protein
MNEDGWSTMNGKPIRLSKSGDEGGYSGRICQADIKRKCNEFFKKRGMETESTLSFGSVLRRKSRPIVEDDDELNEL